MIRKISDNIWKIEHDSNIYIIKFDEWIAIDTGDRTYHDNVIEDIEKIVPLGDISKVLLTHLHYDHMGNLDIFPNAEFFAHKEAIKDYIINPKDTVIGEDFIKEFNISLTPLPDKIFDLKVLHSPGHSRGSVCFYLEKEKILFSGDTLFSITQCGRTDLPTSAPEKLKKTLDMLYKIDIEKLLPGHDYYI